VNIRPSHEHNNEKLSSVVSIAEMSSNSLTGSCLRMRLAGVTSRTI
jgi:hypothetical protein